MQAPHAAPNREYSSYTEFYSESVYSAFPQDHRSAGSFGLHMMRVDQEPIDFVDAAVPDLVFARTESDVRDVLLDLGDGASTVRAQTGMLTYYPAETQSRSRVEVPHTLTILSMSHQKVVDLMADAGTDISCFDSFASRMSENVAAASLMDRIWQAMAEAGPAASLYVDGLAMQFLAVIADSATLSPFGVDHGLDKRITRAIDYLEAHISKSLTVAELAGVAALSPGQFARVFKATTGEAVWAFVQRRRIERARDMLRHTATPISQIAFECGFASQNHMTTLFRRHLGVTPGAVRRLG